MCVDAEFWASYSRGLGSFVAALVCWQIYFSIIDSQNCFTGCMYTKSANLKCFEHLSGHSKPSQRRLGTSKTVNFLANGKRKKDKKRLQELLSWGNRLSTHVQTSVKTDKSAPAQNQTHNPLVLVAVSNPQHKYW